MYLFLSEECHFYQKFLMDIYLYSPDHLGGFQRSVHKFHVDQNFDSKMEV